jgi:hypothetical protein
MTQKLIITRNETPVIGGIAWTQTSRYRKRRPTRYTQMQRDSDGVVRKHRSFAFSKEHIETGYCDECKQMPCPHTAKLLGWI